MDNVDSKIVALYSDNHFSMQQIADEMHLTFHKVKYVLDKNGIKKRNISEAITLLNKTKYSKGSFKIKEKLSAKDQALKIAGVMLYWGEGTKDGNSVVFSNSDPEMVKMFLKFLRKICGISENRIRALVHVYPDHNESDVRNFWSTGIKVPLTQFSKSFVHNKSKGSYKNKSVYGTISLRYSDKQLLKIIKSWILEYSKNI